MKKSIIAAAVAAVLSASASAQNIGFEDGNITGWSSSTTTAVGSQTVHAGSNTWTINPYGSYMGEVQIQSGSYSSMATALGLTSSSTTAIQTMLNTQAQTSGGNPNPTTAGWVTKQVTLTAGQTFTLAWQYVSVDYVPFNDGSIATLTQNGTNVATVNNYQQQYALLGFTNPGTGDYSTGSYGATGWQVATFQVSVDGTYTLGFGVFNMGDTALSPILFIDEVQGTTLKNGTTFGAVAPNNSTAPSSPSVTPPAPTTVSTVNTGTTAGTDTLSSAVTVNGGTIQVATTGVTLTNTFTVDSNGMTVDQNGKTANFSGVISGTGGVTIANTGTGGGVTFSAVNTYTGTTTVNQGASLTNTGTLVSNVTNSGTFNNSSTAANVSNFGTFNNTGTVATANNAGVINNNAGGTINQLGYNNFIVNNNGTINSITYNGGNVVNNTGATIGSINTSQAHGSFNNFGIITGTVTTNSTFNNYTGGSVQGLYTNSGTLNNAGTVGEVNNIGTFTNTGTAGAVTLNTGSTFTNTGTAASVDNTAGLAFTNAGIITGLLTNAGTVTNEGTVGSVNNTGTFTNSGTVGNVTNTGAFTSSGNVSSVTNTGTFNYNGGTVDSYTQTSTGTTSINYGTPLTVTNTATLDGTLIVNNAPTAYGRYTLLTAGSVNGYYPLFSSAGTNDYLKYSSTDVKLYVTPNSAGTVSSISNVTSNLANAINLQSNVVTGSLGNDCSVFGENGACASVSVGASTAGTGDLTTGGLVLGKRIDEHWRAGVFTNAPFNNTTVGNVGITNSPAFGAFATWSEDNLSIQGSAATGQGTLNITRNGPETGTGKSQVTNQAYQLKASYSIPVTETVTAIPYAGIRYSQASYSGYTESGPVFPLTVNGTKKTSTDAIAGVSLTSKLTDDLTGIVSAGVTQNLSGSSATYSGTSEIGNLNTFNVPLPSNGSINTSIGAGLSYNIDKTTKLGVNTGWQQKGSNANITSYGVTLTKGF